LLLYLEAVGFDGAPRVLGIDEEAREILEYVPGVIPWGAKHHRWLGSGEAVRRAGSLLRRFHDHAVGFVPPEDAEWREPERASDAEPWTDERGTIVCHNDPAPWNLVIGDTRWAFIDWDAAGPRPFIWDVAYLAIGLIPITADPSSLGWTEEVPVTQRLIALAEGYGLEVRDRERFVEVLVARIASSYNHLKHRARAGIEPWARLWNEGHGNAWASILSYAQQNSSAWRRSLMLPPS